MSPSHVSANNLLPSTLQPWMKLTISQGEGQLSTVQWQVAKPARARLKPVQAEEVGNDAPSLVRKPHLPIPMLRSFAPLWPLLTLAYLPFTHDSCASDHFFPCPRWVVHSQHASLEPSQFPPSLSPSPSLVVESLLYQVQPYTK
jgi:hypothetical protein